MSADTAASSSNQKLSNLLHWLEQGGARFSRLELIRHEDGERAVLARVPIAAGETVLQVPVSHMLTMELARESEIGRAIQQHLNPDNEDLYLASFLLQEKYREDSFWKPYLDSLPEDYGHMPLFYEEAEYAQLKGTLVLSLLTYQTQALQEDYQRLCEAVPGYERFSPGDFVWARLSVSSRLFNVKKGGLLGQTLVPLADMLNHRRPPDVYWETTADGSAFVMNAREAISAGQEIHDSYGPKSNDLQLLHFGFLTQDNDHDEAFVALRLLEGDLTLEDKRRLLGLAEPTTARPFKLSRQYVHPGTREAFSFLRVGGATGEELQQLAERVKSGEQVLGPLSVDNEERALEFLELVCQARLSTYPTSLEEDARLLKDESLYLNPYNCVLLRHEEKKLLHDYIKLSQVGREVLRLPREEAERRAAQAESPWGWFDAYVRTDLLRLVRGE